jgi:hypothetical protein
VNAICAFFGHRWNAGLTKIAEPGLWRTCLRCLKTECFDEDEPRISTRIAMLHGRVALWKPGFKPTAVELGPQEYAQLCAEGGPNCQIYGMTIRARREPGIALVSMPDRKIGKYEVVLPLRFEETWG